MSKLVIAGRKFNSRLMLGTGKFSSSDVMQKALEISGAEIITVALRRVDINNSQDDILKYIDRDKYLLLPNTSGAKDALEAIRLARLAKATGCEPWVKLEITPEPNHLLPDGVETLKAAEVLVKDGFNVLPYINADPILAKQLEDVGCATVMPLASPIGTNKGIKTLEMIKIIIDNANIPVIIDAGLGLPSHATEAIEIGADGVLVNTAIAVADNPIKMAEAFRYAVLAGELGRDSGPAGVSQYARPSSPQNHISNPAKELLRDIL